MWEREIASWTSHLRAGGRPETTVRLREYHVRRLGREVGEPDPYAVTAEQLVEWFAGHDWSRATRRSVRSSIRSAVGWAIATGRRTDNIALALDPIPATPPMPHPTPDRDYRAALLAAAPREVLMVRLAAELGLRRGEVAQVHGRDLLTGPNGWSLLVHGKGGRDRVVPMSDELAAAVRVAAGEGGGYVFPGRVEGHLSAHYVGKRVSALMPEGVSMHSLRHRFATRAYLVDRDLVTVQQLLGHASPDTTIRYVLPPDDAARRTVLAVAG